MTRLIGIFSVWLGCTIAWVVLGSTLVVRSGESSASFSPEVHQLWGPPLEQQQPVATYADVRMTESTRTITHPNGDVSTETSQRPERVDVPVPLVGSDLEATLALEHRRRGLVWFPTYSVDFRGRYTFENPTAEARDVTFSLPIQAENAVYDGFVVRDRDGRDVNAEIGAGGDGGRSEWSTPQPGSASWRARLAPGERVVFDVTYRTRGTGTWHYRMGHGTTRVSDFRLVVRTDFEEVDFPAGTLSPTEHGAAGSGWRGTWRFDSLIANQPIGIEPPERINPGPLASRITFFAPVGLLFFFFVVAVLGAAQKRELHPMHFFFLGCSFFAFHLLFAYLVDHLSITLSFALSAAVSTFLVISYARLFVGLRFALREMGLSQLIYLVLFSGTFLLEGFTGLAITVGAILTLFVMMQITGRTAWGKKPAPDAAPMEPPRGAESTVPRAF